MSFAPKTLFGRNLLLIASLIIVAELSAGLLFQRMLLRPRAEQFAHYALQYVEAVQAALTALPEAARAPYIAQLNRAGEIRVLAGGEPPASNPEPPGRLLRWALAPLRSELAGRYPQRWQSLPQRRLWLHAAASGQPYWIGFPVERFLTRVSYPLLSAWFVSIGLAVLGAALIQRRINRPLRELAAAAHSVTRGEAVQPVSEQGPAEYAVVARSFNRMAGTLAQAEQERALMLAGVSHDLRTPLTNLRLAIEMLAADGDAALVASAVRNVETADRILDQFIDFARLGSGEAASPTDLNALLREVVESMAASMPGVTLALDPLPLLALRPLAMQRLFANLLTNARRHAAPPFRVATRCGAAKLEIEISDQGPGIPPDAVERVMQPFARLQQARSGTAGAGLGLAIAERIARLHGGSLRLENRAGGGLSVVLSLPLQ